MYLCFLQVLFLFNNRLESDRHIIATQAHSGKHDFCKKKTSMEKKLICAFQAG